MINIRRAQITDAKDYATILNQSWKDTYGEYISEAHIDDELNVNKLIENFEMHISNKDFETYIIEYEGKIIGIVEFGSPDLEDIYKDNLDDFGQLRKLYINKDYQNLGIGKKTEQFVCNSLKKMGYKYIFLWVKKKNSKAIRFYEENGYIKTNYTCENPSDGASSFVMEKVLEEE